MTALTGRVSSAGIASQTLAGGMCLGEKFAPQGEPRAGSPWPYMETGPQDAVEAVPLQETVPRMIAEVIKEGGYFPKGNYSPG